MRRADVDTMFDRSKLKRGENRMPCPTCDRGPSDTAMSVRLEDDGHLVWHCHRLCGTSGSSRTANGELPPQAPVSRLPAEIKTGGIAPYWQALWKATAPIGGAARDYLEARCCVVPPATGDLRCMEALKHPSGHVGPALVARITDAITGHPLSLHRTWIRPDGRKADVEPPRLLLKNHPIPQGVIRLWPGEDVSGSLGIAEGIETALILAHGISPAWACIDAGHLGKLPIIAGVDELVIGADNDPAGRRAAEECAKRWSAHAEVRIVHAEAAGADLNDEVRSWVK